MPGSDRLTGELNPEVIKRARMCALKRLTRFDIPDAQKSADGLVNEAVLRTLEGRRKWKEEKELIFHLMDVINSLASEELERKIRENMPEEFSPEKHHKYIGQQYGVSSTSADAHDYILNWSRMKNVLRILKQENKELFEFFLKVNQTVEATGKVKDSEIERLMKLRPKTISEKRRQVFRLFRARRRRERLGQDAEQIAAENDL